MALSPFLGPAWTCPPDPELCTLGPVAWPRNSSFIEGKVGLELGHVGWRAPCVGGTLKHRASLVVGRKEGRLLCMKASFPCSGRELREVPGFLV